VEVPFTQPGVIRGAADDSPLSGTFFPISTLPAPLPTLAWLSPLWHGVDLARGLALGYAAEEPLVMVAHVVVLSGLTLAGVVWGVRTFTRRLVLG
jgi:lipooligosaccharide transport system permease protein